MADIILGNLKFYWAGDWAPSTLYDKDDVVKYGASVYVCTVSHTSGSAFTENSNKFELMVEGVTSRGEYDQSTLYQVNNIVNYGGSVYISTTETQGNAPTDTNYWQKLVGGFEFEGPWDQAVSYQKGDVVRYGGYTYIALQDSTNQTPTNTQFWSVMTEGFRLRGSWSEQSMYSPGEVVRYGGHLYLNIVQTSSTVPTDTSFYRKIVDGFSFVNEYSNLVEYVPGQIVIYGGSAYINTQASQNEPPTNVTYWSKVSGGVNWTGDWQQSRSYVVGDLVKYGGTIYKCVFDYIFDGSTQQTPSGGLDDSTIYWDVYTEGFRWRGNWTDNELYLDGDVVKYGGNTYLCVVEHTSSTDPGLIPSNLSSIWNAFTEGMSWQGNWDTNTVYKQHEVVEYAQSSYISLIPNNIANQPDISGAEWDLVAQGDTNAVMTQRGDIAVRGTNSVERLGIGPAGSYLYSDGTDIKWGSQAPTNTFYVALTGDDTNDGKTPATAWRTLSHACEQTYNYGQCSISLFAGTYEEHVPMKVGRAVVVEGQGLGAVTISPNNTDDFGFGVGISKDGSTPNANSEVFQMNNAARLRNVVFRGFGNGSVCVSLDPGYGPDDTSVWITSQSPYVQNCTSFTPEGTGMIIDGALHNGGYKSMVANDWTQINSDGVGIHVKNDARCELVSVFTYYCNPGYLAESGGKIRSVNGSSAYGEHGIKATGFSQNETPLEGYLQLSDDTINSVNQLGNNLHVPFTYKDTFGNVYMTGYTNPTAGDASGTWDNTASNPAVVKFNADGTFDWAYTFTGQFGALHTAIEIDNAIYVAGVIYDAGQNKGIVLKISRSGEVQWAKVISDTAEIVDITQDDVYLYAVGNHATAGTTVMKISQGGITQWSRTLDYSQASTDTVYPTSVTFANEPTTSTDTYANAGDGTAATNIYIALRDDTNNQAIIARMTTSGGFYTAYEYGDLYINRLELDTGNGDGIYLAAAGYHVDTVRKPFVMRLGVDGTVQWQSTVTNYAANAEWTDVLPFGNDVYVSGYANVGGVFRGLTARYTSTGAVTWIYETANGTNDIVFKGVVLDGVNVISGGIDAANSVLQNVQRDTNFGIGSVTSGNYTFVSDPSTSFSQATIANASVHEMYLQSPALGVTDAGLLLDSSPGITRTVAATRQGFAGIGTGINFRITGLSRQPKEGSVIHIEGDDQTYFCIGVSNYVENFGVNQDNNPNTVEALTLNKEWIQDETMGWLAATYPEFTYDETKCRRDTSYIIDATRYDMVLGTNFNSVTNGLAYQRGSAGTLQSDQKTETVAAIEYLRDYVIANYTQNNGTAITRLRAGYNEILDILVNGVVSTDTAADPLTFTIPPDTSVNIQAAFDRLVANKLFIQDEIVAYVDANSPPAGIDTSVCGRDTGYIVDALCYDILYGGNSASINAALAYFEGTNPVVQTGDEIAATVAAYQHLQSIVSDIVQGNAITPTTGNQQTQDITGQNSSGIEAAELDTLIQYIVDVVNDADTTSLPANTTYPDISWADSGLISVDTNIYSNKADIVDATINQINTEIAFIYDNDKCRRDIGLIIDAIITDLDSSTLGSIEQNDETVEAGLRYYTQAGGVDQLQVPDVQRDETIEALEYAKGLITNAIAKTSPAQTYSDEIQNTTHGTPETDSQAYAENLMQIVIDIVRNGTAAAPAITATGYADIAVDPAITSNKTPDDNTFVVFREAFSQVRMTGHDFLDIGTGGFADTNYPVIIASDYSQAPDQNRETVAEDGGRVFYVTTDQDGNFRVGDYFKVEQATGRATLSSEEFDLSGLNELQLGSIRAGKSGATVNEFSTDGTMADNSDQAVPTERAIVTYIDTKLATNQAQAFIVRDVDGDTRIQVQETNNENTIRFDTAGSERLIIGPTGQITAATGYAPSANLDLTTKEYVDAKGDIAEGDSQITVTDTGSNGSANFIMDGTTRATVTASGLALENGTRVSEFSTDTTLADASDSAVPTEAAVKAYVDANFGAVSLNSISQNDSNVTVTDSGTGIAAIAIDGANRLTVNATQISTQNGAIFSGDLTGNVTGNVTGSASNNILNNANDTFSGRLSNTSLNQTPAISNGVLHFQPSTAGGATGIMFESRANAGSDSAYIWWYDDNNNYRKNDSIENGALVIGIQNDGNATSEDAIAIESSGDIFLNPGNDGGLTNAGGATGPDFAEGRVYIGRAATRYEVYHEGNLSPLSTSGGTLTGTLNSQAILPTASGSYDLGSDSLRWRNIYVNDLQMSNKSKAETGGNDVDGTWGDYTIQEGEEDLFLINNRNGKTYKFVLQEVKK